MEGGVSYRVCAVLYGVFMEVLTEEMILEQKPERRERENHSGI